MLPSGATPVPSLPDRAPAERSEASSPDPSDGRFASLMAQFVPAQIPVQPKAQDPAQPATPGPAASAGPATGPATPAGPASPDTSAGQAASGPNAPSTPAVAPAKESPSGRTGAADVASGAPQPVAPAKDDPVPEAQLPAQAPVVLPVVATLPAAAPAQATSAASMASGPAGGPDATTLTAAGLPGAGKTGLVVPSAAPQDAPRQATPTTVPPIASTPAGVPVSQADKAGLSLASTVTQNAAPQDPATIPNTSLTAAPASGAPAAQPAAPQSPVSLSLPSLVIAAAPAQAAAPSTDNNKSVSGNGPIPAATVEQASGPAAGKPEGDAASSDTPDRADRGASFQIHLTPDAGPQTALAASTRPVPVAAGVPQATPAPAVHAPAPAPPVAQVESGVRWMLKSGAQEAHLQLHPDSLGQVTIHLRVEGGEVHARLWVSEAASVKAVQEGRPHLELSLKEQGLQLGSFDLQQGHRPFQETTTPQAARFPDRLPVLPARQEPPAPITPTLLNPHQIELYA